MKKIVAICAVGVALVLAGCASQDRTVDYSGENAAPYSDSRTAGGETVTTTRGDTTFSRRQVK